MYPEGVDKGVDTVDVGGVKVAFRQAGTGEPLVLLHGAYESSRDWIRQLEDLSDEFTVVAWDAPGCGGSDDPRAGMTSADYGRLLAGFLHEIGLASHHGRRPHVLGLSWGSVLALELYRTDPDLPATLILASAYAGWAGSLPAVEVERRVAQAIASVERPIAETVAALLPTMLSPTPNPATVAAVSRSMMSTRSASIRGMTEATAREDYRPVLPMISVPTLLLAGALDVRSPVAVAQEMQRQIRGADLVVLPGVGHLSYVEDPVAFNAAVRAWIHRREATAPPDGEDTTAR